MHVLQTLGALDLRSEDGTVARAVLAQPKRVGVLCYLSAARPFGFHARDALIAMFWPELDEEHARNALNQAVHFLRRKLGTEAILSRDQNELGIDRDLVRCDKVEFERCIERGTLEKAMSIYQGDFLHAFHIPEAVDFEHWVDLERARLRELASEAAWQLAARSRDEGDVKAAAALARRSSALAPYDEDRARETISLLLDAGQLPEAIAFHEAFAQRLWDDLALRPSAETRALIDRARMLAAKGVASDRATPAQVTSTLRPASGEPPNLEETLRRELGSDLEIVRFLGRGSTALAFLAREPALKRLVAVKVLRPELALDPIARERFEREAQAAARISHTNVASVHRVGKLTGGTPYMVNEYVEGRSLAELLAARSALAEVEARRIVAALASGLAAAHDRGVIHRDVRPGNIFVENRTERVVLTDFGIAALLVTGADDPRKLTPFGVRLGDVRYSSPEQVQGEPITELSDVYALGVVAFEVLTGRHPFEAEVASGKAAGQLQKMSSGRAVLPDQFHSDLASVIERCLASQANVRPRARDIVVMLGSR